MTTLLVTISLLLHAFTFLWIITLMKRQQHVQPLSTKENEDKLKSEIEDLLVSYTVEMKEENERLVKQLKQLKATPEKKSQGTSSEENPSPKQSLKESERVKQVPTRESITYDDYSPPLIEEDQMESDMYEQSDTAKVLALAKQGLHAEEIAKKLSLGKGEVELMLKFYR
ncbi:hypothetical protein N0O92_02070 [Alkalihalobacillus sp. MEB130]|uniref:DUF6115 domain-containing protein n=1 Tax=Alkalihalobacillus sp. MEB130 TaxID=2976704 RepID=UPI0028DE1000|nr:hypothetical protein [Alkalihalobacillus sp. MEB130]MDT8859000.1 hypothetical protein [Alkalihalobacillus sp. MEB130]